MGGHYLVADAQAQAHALPHHLRREERIEDLLAHVLGNAPAVVRNSDHHMAFALVEEAANLLVSMKKEAQDIPLTQVDDKLAESYDALAEALTHLDEMVFILGEYDSQGALDETTSDLAHDLTTQVETLSVQALEVKKIIDKIDAHID